jgi:TRAP-type C4-dicarboxylate transport system permease small subunit
MVGIPDNPPTSRRAAIRTITAIRLLLTIGLYCSVLLTAAIMLLTVADVTARYFVHRPIAGAFELTEYVFLGATVLSFGYVELVRGHVQVRFALDWLNPESRRILTIINLLLALAISLTFTWYSSKSSIESFVSAEFRQGNIIDLPMWPARASLTLGFGMFCLALLANIISEWFRIEGSSEDIGRTFVE